MLADARARVGRCFSPGELAPFSRPQFLPPSLGLLARRTAG